MIRELLRRFMTPDAYVRDAAGFVLNQAGHFGAVGAPAFWIASTLAAPWAALAMVAIGYALVEAAQARFGGQSFRDALEDWAFVMLGALWMFCILAGDHVGAWQALASVVAGLAFGAWRRW